MDLSSVFDEMKKYPQFINWIKGEGKKGEVLKLPVDPHTGQVCVAHDPAFHVSYEEARGTGLDIAFVFTENDPFWFLDLDHCLEGNQWNETAHYFLKYFKGAAVEVSQSMTALHQFGKIPDGATPNHCCDCKPIKSQFYTSKRFVALTGIQATGSCAWTPTTEVYNKFITDYFPGKAAAPVTPGGPAGWTDAPNPAWSGPDDDEELIKRMLRSKSARGILGATVTIRQLWEADEEALGKIFPDNAGTQGRAFDWTSADAALCSHLAFWTGSNCERMDRLFRLSALNRDKWEDRLKYRESTIFLATDRCTTFYKQRVKRDPVAAVEPGATVTPGYEYYAVQDQISFFAGCRYVIDQHKTFIPKGALLRPDQFKVIYGGHVFALDAMGDKTTKNAWEVFTESQAHTFDKVDTTCFRPERDPGEIINVDGNTAVNTYVPVITERKAGDVSPFLDLVTKMLPSTHDQGVLLAYLAACVQHVGVKFQWAVLLQGAEGNGKSFISRLLVKAIGEKYSHILDPKDISNVFNSWLQNKLLILVEEVYTNSKMSTVESLKWMITNERVPTQAKGVDQTTGDNRANFFMCSNHRDAVQKTASDRRFCVFYTAQQEYGDLMRDGMDGGYFPRLYNWAKSGGYAIINDYLREYKIPDALNPATSCHRAPATSTTAEVIVGSRSPIEQCVVEAIEAGKTGFSGGWISSAALDTLLHDIRMPIAFNKRRDLVKGLGYVPHPGLRNGRVNNPIVHERMKPILYIKENHISINCKDAAMVSKMYQEAQGYVALPPDHAAANQI